MRCPHCGSVVEPLRDTAGALFCPACQNSGQVSAAWAQPAGYPTPAAPSDPAALGHGAGPLQASAYGPMAYPPANRPASGKAIASMVVGICSIVMYFLGIVLGPIALGLGISARADIKRLGLGGNGMGLAGIILGAIGTGIGILTIAMFAFLFTAIDDLEGDTTVEMSFEVDGSGAGGTLTVVEVTGSGYWYEYELGGTARCSLPNGDVQEGDQIVCVTDGDVVVIEWDSGETIYATTV